MAVAVTGVDATLISWILRNADERLDRTPLAALDKAVAYFAGAGRHEHNITEGGVSAVLSLYNHDRLIKTIRTSDHGTLHARIENRDGSASWQDGTLTLERRVHQMPETVLGNLVGRRLRDVVDAEWLSDTARIVEVDENRVHVMIVCDTWITPLAQARDALERREKP